MIDQPIFTIALLIMASCNIVIAWLYWRIWKWTNTPADLYSLWSDIEENQKIIINRLGDAADRQRGMKQALVEDGKLTRKQIADEHKKTRKETQEIKTRLTWSRKRELKGGK